MPDLFEQAAAEYKGQQQGAPPSPSGSADPFAQAASEYHAQRKAQPSVGDALTRAGKSFLGETLHNANPVNIAAGGYQMLRHPIDTANAALNDMRPWRDKAAAEARKGNIGEAAADEISGLVPVLGPNVGRVREAIDKQDWDAVGKETGDLLAAKTVPGIYDAAGAGLSNAARLAPDRIPPLVRNHLGATEKAAMSELQKQGVPLSVGQRTGSKVVRSAERALEHVPGAAGPAQRFFDRQGAAAEEALRRYPKQVGGTDTDAVGAGEHVVNSLKGRINDLKTHADRQYDAVRQRLEEHRTGKQTQDYEAARAKWDQELKDYMSKPLDTNAANPFTGEVPDNSPPAPRRPKYAAEVNASQIRSQLRPLYDELATAMPETQRASSPGYAVLKRLVEGKDDVHDALTLERDLGTVKAMLRRNAGSYLADSSQRYARRTILAMESGLEKSLTDIDPQLMNRLREGRRAVKEYHGINEFMAQLVPEGESPVKAFNTLTRNGETQLEQLRKLKALAPDAAKTVGQTYLQGLVDKATSEGGLSRSASILNQWRALGPRVKTELFGRDLSQSIDRFLVGAKKLGLDQNPSGTAKWRAALGGGELGAALSSLLVGSVAPAAAAAGTTIASNLLARVLFSDRGAKLLTDAVSLPFGTKLQREALAGVSKIAAENGKDEPPPPSGAPPSPSPQGRRQSPPPPQNAAPAAPGSSPVLVRRPPPTPRITKPAPMQMVLREQAATARAEQASGRRPEAPPAQQKRTQKMSAVPEATEQANEAATPSQQPETPDEPQATTPATPDSAIPPASTEPEAPPASSAAEPETVAAPMGEAPKPDIPPTEEKTPLDRAKEAEPDLPPSLQKGKVAELHRSEIEIDPKRFQFKQKAIGKGGTTDEMRDVEQFDPEKAGVISVWKDPKNSKTYVVNGHHRLERANALKHEDPLLVRYLNAKNAASARTKGALINIAEGRGEPMDAAKVFREGKIKPDELKDYGISRTAPVAKQGMSLARLSDPVFEDVATGKLPEGRGVVIGEMLENPSDQEAAAKLSRDADSRGKKLTDNEFRETIRLIKNAPRVSESQESLFGTETVEKNLGIEKGEISSYIQSQLATDRRIFGQVSKSAAAQKLEGAGNVLKGDANAARAKQATQAIELYNRLSGMSGSINDMLDQAARELAEGVPAGDVKQRAYERIAGQLDNDLSQLQRGRTRGVKEGDGGTVGDRRDSAPPRKRKSNAPPSG